MRPAQRRVGTGLAPVRLVAPCDAVPGDRMREVPGHPGGLQRIWRSGALAMRSVLCPNGKGDDKLPQSRYLASAILIILNRIFVKAHTGLTISKAGRSDPLKKLSPVRMHRASTSLGSLPRDTSSTATGSNFGEEGFEVVPISFVSFRYQHTKEGSRGFLYARQPANVARGG